jgi:hypothetical protein
MTYTEIVRQELEHLLMNAGSPVPNRDFSDKITHDLLDKLGFAYIQREYNSTTHDVQCVPDFKKINFIEGSVK